MFTILSWKCAVKWSARDLSDLCEERVVKVKLFRATCSAHQFSFRQSVSKSSETNMSAQIGTLFLIHRHRALNNSPSPLAFIENSQMM